jgi:hypothetical protein
VKHNLTTTLSFVNENICIQSNGSKSSYGPVLHSYVWMCFIHNMKTFCRMSLNLILCTWVRTCMIHDRLHTWGARARDCSVMSVRTGTRNSKCNTNMNSNRVEYTAQLQGSCKSDLKHCCRYFNSPLAQCVVVSWPFAIPNTVRQTWVLSPCTIGTAGCTYHQGHLCNSMVPQHTVDKLSNTIRVQWN